MYDQYENHIINVGGINTRYVEVGEGQPLLLIHGGGAGADGVSNYSNNMPLYAEQGYRVIAPDMVGFGRTDKPSPDEFEYTQATRTQHMIDFIDAMGLQELCVVGNSMGGITATEIALKRPDLISKLVLMGAPVNVSVEDMHANKKNLSAVIQYDETEAGMRRLIDNLTFNYVPSDELVTYRYQAFSVESTKKAYRTLMKWVAENGMSFSPEELQSLRCKTLVVAGKNDIMVPFEKALELTTLIPDANCYFIPNCGHWCMLEYPELFCSVTDSFFKHS